MNKKGGDIYISETQKNIQKQREQLVVQSNKLITRTQSQLKLRELRLLLYVISKIKPSDEPTAQYKISIREFAQMCGAKDPHYGEIKKIVIGMNKTFWIDDFGGKGDNVGFVWFKSIVYNQRKGTIGFLFNELIWPYLFALQAHYTSYPLTFVLPMRSQYSVRLYELLKMHREKNPVHSYFSFKLEDLRKMLGAETYTKWNNFKIRVLEPALGEMNSTQPIKGEINIYSDIKAVYKIEKLGRMVDSVVFHVMKKQSEELNSTINENQMILDNEMLRAEDVIPYLPPVQERDIVSQTVMDDLYMEDSENLLENEE